VGVRINRESNAAGIVWKSEGSSPHFFGADRGENGAVIKPQATVTRERSLPGQDARMALISSLAGKIGWKADSQDAPSEHTP